MKDAVKRRKQGTGELQVLEGLQSGCNKIERGRWARGWALRVEYWGLRKQSAIILGDVEVCCLGEMEVIVEEIR